MNKLFSTILLLILTLNVFGQINVLEFDGTKNQNVTVRDFYPQIGSEQSLIWRNNSVRNQPPTSTEFPEPVESVNAYIILSDLTYENWFYTGGTWGTRPVKTTKYLTNKFTFEAWLKVKPNDAGGYFGSDDYGGSHAFLGGIFKGVGNLYAISGNVRSRLPNGTYTTFSFNSPPIITANKWHLYCVELDEDTITSFVDGIPVAKNPFQGKRIAGSGGSFYIGGSDHINFSGWMTDVRYVEDEALYKGQGYTGQVSFTDSLRIRGTNTIIKSNLLFDFTNKGLIIPDISHGYNGIRHNGTLRNASNGLFFENNGGELPKWKTDNDFPFIGTPTTEAPYPETSPSNAVIFDSFNRQDITSLNGQNAQLGTTEVGNKTWTSNIPLYIQFGQAVHSTPNYNVTALVEAPSHNGKVKVDRIQGYDTGLKVRANGFNTGIAFFTSNNIFIAYKFVNGAVTESQTTALGACSYLEVTMNNSNVTATCGASTITVTDNTTNKEVGLYSFSPSDFNRFDNFLVSN